MAPKINKFTQQNKKRSLVVIRGAWTDDEDKKLSKYVEEHGEKKWETVALKAGLNRCGKSCRLRWLNYLRPNIKRGNITPEEEDLILRLHKLLGNRWSLIAGRLPGRTDNEIKNYWNSHLSKKLHQQAKNIQLPAPPATSLEFPAPPTTTTSTIMEESTTELEETTLWEESGGDNVGSEDTKSSFDDISEILNCSSDGACDVDWADQFLVLEQPGY